MKRISWFGTPSTSTSTSTRARRHSYSNWTSSVSSHWFAAVTPFFNLFNSALRDETTSFFLSPAHEYMPDNISVASIGAGFFARFITERPSSLTISHKDQTDSKTFVSATSVSVDTLFLLDLFGTLVVLLLELFCDDIVVLCERRSKRTTWLWWR